MPCTKNIRIAIVTATLSGSLLSSSTAGAGFLFGPDNYPECILDRLEAVQNDLVAISETSECRREFPDAAPLEKSSSFLFGPETVAQCVADSAQSTPSSYAANQIREACFQLYPETAD